MSRTMVVAAVLVMVLFAPGVLGAAGKEEGGLSRPEVDTLRRSFQVDGETRAIMNAVANNELRKIALDQETRNAGNMLFSNKIETKGITNQNSTGRCWMYAALNVLRLKVIQTLNLEEFEFSQSYLFFWDKLEKANLFLESIIERRDRPVDDREIDWLFEHPIPDGGQWGMVVDLIEKYGVVPSYAMPENEQSKNSNVWNALLSQRLRKDALELRRMNDGKGSVAELRSRKMEMLEEIYRILAITLGNPPAEFVWRYEDKDKKTSEPKTYTPKAFYDEVVGVDLTGYVYLLSNPLQDYGKVYQVQFDRDMFDKSNMTVLNVPADDLRDYTLASVLAGEPVWFGCDVGKEHFRDKGAGMLVSGVYRYDAVYGVDFSFSKTERLLTRDSVPSHSMVFTGVDVADGKPVKWLVENSWGEDFGVKGMWIMSDAWFEDYVYGSVVQKKYVPEKVLRQLGQKPVVLPPWDPMFAAAMWE